MMIIFITKMFFLYVTIVALRPVHGTGVGEVTRKTMLDQVKHNHGW